MAGRGVLLSVILFTACAAYADEAQNASDPTEVVVTARRVAEDPQKIPVAVTSLNATKLETLAINSVLDLNKVPGLSGAPIGSRTSMSFAIRGQGTAYAGQPGVIPYFAEVPNFSLSYFDLQSVQVIKGPQGTLFGQTSTGGVVLFEPKRPTENLEGYVDVQGGDYSYRRVRGALNIPLVEGRLLARVAGEIRKRNGWSTGIYSNPAGARSDLNDVDDGLFRASLTWKPSTNLDIYSVYAEDRRRTQGASSVLYYMDPRFMNPAVRNVVPASVPSLAATWKYWTGSAPTPGQTFARLLADALDQQLADGPFTTRTDFNQRNKTVNRGVVNQVNWDITNDVRVRNIVGMRWQAVRGANYDLDGTNLPLDSFECRYVPQAVSSTSRCATTGGWPARTLSEELQIQGHAFGDRLEWQTGAFYLRGGVRRFIENTQSIVLFGTLNADPASRAFCASVGVAWPCASMARSITQSKALFGQATWQVVQGVHLTAGYRETWDYARTDTSAKPSYQIPIDGQLITVPTYGQSVANGARTLSTAVDLPANDSYNVSLDWQITDSVLAYLAHRSGYKTGGINATADPGTPQRTYGPERAKDLELGAKTQWSAGFARGTVNADVYHTRYSDIQEGQIIPGTASTVTSNIAAAGITGFEVESNVSLGRWLQLAASVAYVDARYRDWLEYSTCGAQYWRPQCTGLAATTVVAIDHAKGKIDIAGNSISFEPDRFLNASRWQWSFQPTVSLEPWLAKDITFGATVYHRGPYVDSVATTNRSITAGVPMAQQDTVFGYSTANPFDAPGYTLTDVYLNWHKVAGTNLSLAAVVTNAANKVYRVSSSSPFLITGAVYSVVGEPRMGFVQATYTF